MTKQQQAERDEAKARLLQWLKPGDTVYTIVRHVSRSGMQREIGVVIPLMIKPDIENFVGVDHEGKMQYPPPTLDFVHLNYAVAQVLGWRVSKDRDAVIVGGCGMDMGFHLVYELSHALFGDGYALQQRWL